MATVPKLPVLRPREAYDIVAPDYDEWHWQEFWRRNELPIVTGIVDALPAVRFAADVGTGTGNYLEALSHRNVPSVGVDLSRQMLLAARRRLNPGVALVQSDVVALALATDAFDLVLCCRVLSHVRRLDQAISELARVLRPGRILIITDVSSEHDYELTRVPAGGKLIGIETIKWTDKEVAASAGRAGLSVMSKQRLTSKDLVWLPRRRSFAAIDRSATRAIGYVMCLRKE